MHGSLVVLLGEFAGIRAIGGGCWDGVSTLVNTPFLCEEGSVSD